MLRKLPVAQFAKEVSSNSSCHWKVLNKYTLTQLVTQVFNKMCKFVSVYINDSFQGFIYVVVSQNDHVIVSFVCLQFSSFSMWGDHARLSTSSEPALGLWPLRTTATSPATHRQAAETTASVRGQMMKSFHLLVHLSHQPLCVFIRGSAMRPPTGQNISAEQAVGIVHFILFQTSTGLNLNESLT